jgi:hypothetical protein
MPIIRQLSPLIWIVSACRLALNLLPIAQALLATVNSLIIISSKFLLPILLAQLLNLLFIGALILLLLPLRNLLLIVGHVSFSFEVGIVLR